MEEKFMLCPTCHTENLEDDLNCRRCGSDLAAPSTSLLTMPDTVAVLEQAFGAMADGCVENQPRSRIMLANGVLNMLAAAIPTLGVLGYKTYTAFRNGVRFVVMLYSANDGQLLAIIEA